MYDDLLKRLTADGREQFSAQDIQAEMDKIFEEEVDKMAQYHLKDHPEAVQPVTWQQAAEGIEPALQREPNGELER